MTNSSAISATIKTRLASLDGLTAWDTKTKAKYAREANKIVCRDGIEYEACVTLYPIKSAALKVCTSPVAGRDYSKLDNLLKDIRANGKLTVTPELLAEAKAKYESLQKEDELEFVHVIE